MDGFGGARMSCCIAVFLCHTITCQLTINMSTQIISLSKFKPRHDFMDVSEDRTRAFYPENANSESDFDRRCVRDETLENGNIYYVHFKADGLRYILLQPDWVYNTCEAKVCFGDSIQLDYLDGITSQVDHVLEYGNRWSPFFEHEVKMIVDLSIVPTVFCVIDKQNYGSVWAVNGPLTLSIIVNESVELINDQMHVELWEAYQTTVNKYGVRSIRYLEMLVPPSVQEPANLYILSKFNPNMVLWMLAKIVLVHFGLEIIEKRQTEITDVFVMAH
jgi:hypothetical protein